MLSKQILKTGVGIGVVFFGAHGLSEDKILSNESIEAIELLKNRADIELSRTSSQPLSKFTVQQDSPSAFSHFNQELFCRRLLSQPTTLFCRFETQGYLSAGLVRASSFSEGQWNDARRGYEYLQRSQVVPPLNILNARSIGEILGINIPTKEIEKYLAAKKSTSETIEVSDPFNYKKTPLVYELAVEDILLKKVVQHPDIAYLIAVDASSLENETILSHELKHGQFYSDPSFQKLIKEFWSTQILPEDRQIWRDTLENHSYDSHNERVVIDEFQAYCLQDEAYSWAKIPNKYREALRNFLRDNN